MLVMETEELIVTWMDRESPNDLQHPAVSTWGIRDKSEPQQARRALKFYFHLPRSLVFQFGLPSVRQRGQHGLIRGGSREIHKAPFISPGRP